MVEEPATRKASREASPEGVGLWSHQVGVFVAFVCQMGVDVPTSAAVDGRDSDHRRRCVIIRLPNTGSIVRELSGHIPHKAYKSPFLYDTDNPSCIHHMGHHLSPFVSFQLGENQPRRARPRIA